LPGSAGASFFTAEEGARLAIIAYQSAYPVAFVASRQDALLISQSGIARNIVPSAMDTALGTQAKSATHLEDLSGSVCDSSSFERLRS
jgi:hypothetical protein